MDTPLLVVVTGMPASGKSTVAEGIAAELELPLLAKDDLKETLFETLGSRDEEYSHRLGEAAYALLFGVAASLLRAGCSLILEANFFRGSEPQFLELPPHRLVQVHCDAPLALIEERYASRNRHPGHHDEEKVGELAERYASGAHLPLELPGELVELDTSTPVDPRRFARELRTRTARRRPRR